MLHLFQEKNNGVEICFNILTSEELTVYELEKLKRILAEGFDSSTISEVSTLPMLEDGTILEIGPRMNFATAFHTNLLSALHVCGLTKITRIERSRRNFLPSGMDVLKYSNDHHDRMTETVYQKTLQTFNTGLVPEQVQIIPLMEKGIKALQEIPGLAMDEWDMQFYYDYFVGKLGRNPTDVELQDLNNANSEHCRHGYFKGKIVIDGVEMTETLMDLVKSTLQGTKNSVIAFSDNSSSISGVDVLTIVPEYPGKSSRLIEKQFRYDLVFTAETHNFPMGIAPFPGAETGTGGRIRDNQAVGRGGLVIAGTVGYCVGNLFIPGYKLPWENENATYPDNLATSLDAEIQASNGASDYGNKFGEPVIAGFTRSVDLKMPNGERWGFGKKIMFTGGIGQMDHSHARKNTPEKGDLIVQIGGPAYRIGVGGGAASSMLQGENDANLDFNAVQRGDAEMAQKVNRIVRACIEMGEDNPIMSIHDQGAAGPGNVLKELVEETGGKIEIRNIKSGDASLSVLEIWIAEYQERNGLLISPERIEQFQEICERERVNCEILGEVTDDGWFVVHDRNDNTTPVRIELDEVLGNMPQKTFYDEHIVCVLAPLVLPENTVFIEALELVLKNLAVCSKGFLVKKVDRSVTGLIARQQCCGPLQLPVSDVAVIAQSHLGLTGAATAIGEQPIKMLLDPEAGARMAIGEAITNLMSAKITSLSDVKCSVNWMWAPKLPGEGAAMYDAAVSATNLIKYLGFGIDGGKDSLSMAVKNGDEIIKSPRQMVVSVYVGMDDIRNVLTPDIKSPGESDLIFIDLAEGECRLGGSVLGQVYEQLGDDCPNVENPDDLKKVVEFLRLLIGVEDGLLSGHDVSDGGLITTLLEMAFSGNCGLEIETSGFSRPIERFFSEELGYVLECSYCDTERIMTLLKSAGLSGEVIARTTVERKVRLIHNEEEILHESLYVLRSMWEETSYQIDLLQANASSVGEERSNTYKREGPQYKLSFTPKATPHQWGSFRENFPVAILREEGSNGDREMSSAFYAAGFSPHDVNMNDLISGEVSLDQFRGLVAVGGFSFADYPSSAKGWASVIRENPNLFKQFKKFFERKDTFSLGVCNGCQLFSLLGIVPWENISDESQPRFIQNDSERFESRWSNVKVFQSPSIMLKGMEESNLGIWVAHGEGKLHFPDPIIQTKLMSDSLVCMMYVDDNAYVTEKYPFNPNGSPSGITAICSPDGRHLAMMPHPERAFLKWQWPWMPEKLNRECEVSPWLQMFQNARIWCEENS